LILTKVVFT